MQTMGIASEGNSLKQLMAEALADYPRFIELIAQSGDRGEAADRLAAHYGRPVELAQTLLDQQFFQLTRASRQSF